MNRVPTPGVLPVAEPSIGSSTEPSTVGPSGGRSIPRLAFAAPGASSVAAVVLAMVVGGVFLLARGHDPIEVYRLIGERGFLDGDGLSETVQKMAPVLLIGTGLLVSLRAGIWNIGLDGQLVVGALAGGVVAGELVGEPRAVLLVAGLAAGTVGGLGWAVAPAALRIRFGLNEIITTLMMNYVAFNVVSWLAKGPFRDPERNAPQTTPIPLGQRLPDIPGTSVHVGLVLGLAAVLAVSLVLRTTVLGTMLDVLGRSPRAAAHAGFPTGRLIATALLTSGGLAGLAGAVEVLGVQGLFNANAAPGYGFTAFALVYLARLRAWAIVPFALLLSGLLVGGPAMSRRAEVPSELVEVLEGLLLVCFAVAVWFERRWGR